MEISSNSESDCEENQSSDEEMTEYESDLEGVDSEIERESQSSEDEIEEDESDENANDTTDTEENTKKVKNERAMKKPITKSKQGKKSKSKKVKNREIEKQMKEAEEYQTKIFTEEVQMANEISNKYATDTLTHYIPINADEQRKIFFNWICESAVETKNINYEEWQNTHSGRETYFFGPDNVIEYYFQKL